MGNEQNVVKEISERLQRIAGKQSRIEVIPICFDEGVTVTHREIHVIQVIGENEGTNVSNVSNHFGVTKSAASQLVSRLERKGFVRKDRSPDSAKELRLSLKDLGWRAFRAHDRLHEKQMMELAERFGTLTESQLVAASAFLDIFEEVIDERLSELSGKRGTVRPPAR